MDLRKSGGCTSVVGRVRKGLEQGVGCGVLFSEDGLNKKVRNSESKRRKVERKNKITEGPIVGPKEKGKKNFLDFKRSCQSLCIFI